MPPLVSILIPAYNAQDWLADTLESAIAQTWPRKEIIVVDDGSKDQTPAVAKRFASKEVAVVTQPNQGAAAARNKALSLSQGEYIQWLDADDLLSTEKVARQMEVALAASSRTLLSSAWGGFAYRIKAARFSTSPLWADLSPLEWMQRKWEANAHMQTATWLVHRSLTDAAGPWDTRLMGDDDGEYFSRVIMQSEAIRFVQEAKVYYRITGSNRLSHIGRSQKKQDAHFLGMKMQIGYIRSLDDSPRTRAACVHYLQTWLHHFYPERLDIVEQARQLAAELGGQLSNPTLPWKYAWIEKLLGWNAAKNCQLRYNYMKSSLLRAWDKTRFQLEGAKRKPAA